MGSLIRNVSWPAGISLAAVLTFACSSVEEKPTPPPAARLKPPRSGASSSTRPGKSGLRESEQNQSR